MSIAVEHIRGSTFHGRKGEIDNAFTYSVDYVLLDAEATPRAPFDLIAEAIDVVVFMSRAGGQRRVEEALRVTGFNGEGYDTAPLVSRCLSLVTEGTSL